MEIQCRSCYNDKSFVLPLWVRATFKIEDSGAISILHVRQLEFLEEKLIDQASLAALNCTECGSNDVAVQLGEYGQADQSRRELVALEGLDAGIFEPDHFAFERSYKYLPPKAISQ